MPRRSYVASRRRTSPIPSGADGVRVLMLGMLFTSVVACGNSSTPLVEPADTALSIGAYCGSKQLQSQCPSNGCVKMVCGASDYSVCADPARPRCGTAKCNCLAGTRCYTPACSDDEGVCLTNEEAVHMCATFPTTSVSCVKEVPQPFVPCPPP